MVKCIYIGQNYECWLTGDYIYNEYPTGASETGHCMVAVESKYNKCNRFIFEDIKNDRI